MKKFIYVILITLLMVLPCLAKQTDADKEVARTQEFIAATMKKGAEKISALNAYVKKFPESSSRWTRLAYYNLVVEYFQTKKYAQAAKFGEKTLKMGSLSEGEEGRLLLVVANSYGVKSASIFNKDKALEWAKKAVSFAQAKNVKDVLAEAKKLKKQLSGPPPKKISPEQKIKMHYADEEFSAAISYYKGLGAADKNNPEIHKTYANALFKANKLDSALNEFKTLYSKDKKGIFAIRLADIYAKKSRRNKKLIDLAVDYYLEASLLYSKEGNSSNQKVAYQKAEYQLFEKYGFNAKIKKYNETLKKSRSSVQKNESEIRRLKRELRKHKRRLYREYDAQDLEAPSYERDKTRKLQQKIRALESGVSPQSTDAGAKLEEERKRIKKELDELKAKAKKRLGL